MGDVGGGDGTQYATVLPVAVTAGACSRFSVRAPNHKSSVTGTVIIGQVGAKNSKTKYDAPSVSKIPSNQHPIGGIEERSSTCSYRHLE